MSILISGCVLRVLTACQGSGVPEVVEKLEEGFVMRPVLFSISGKLCRDHVNHLLAALGCIHHNGFVCRDIRPENILVSVDGKAYLTDFGFAQGINELTQYEGTLTTASNEILRMLVEDRNAALPVSVLDDFESLAKSLFLISTNQRVKAKDAAGVLRFWENPQIPTFWLEVFAFIRAHKFQEAEGLLKKLC